MYYFILYVNKSLQVIDFTTTKKINKNDLIDFLVSFSKDYDVKYLNLLSFKTVQEVKDFIDNHDFIDYQTYLNSLDNEQDSDNDY